ncbi:cation:proton antiporter domain-containing protein [Streptomyces mirabilis]|uniref:cation:proton antiporter domain-containing protein n=1 Tax=Streptomyces mirabilis TaxID=68239 RepID=UPI0036DCADBD
MVIEIVTDGRPFSWSGTALAFVESYAGGIVIGAAIALLLIPVRRRPPEPLFHSVLSVATPLLAYLSAEPLHVSGVLAVDTCGLVTTRFGPRVIGSGARIQVIAFWEVAGYLLNSAPFMFVGIQLPAAVGALTSVSLAQAAIAACAVSVAVIGTRLLWFYSVPCPVRFLDRRPQQRDRRITAPQRLPRAWAGMRGAISPAAAPTQPAVTAEGHVVEQRDAVGPPLPAPFDAVRACGASNPPCFRSSGTRSGTCATPAASDRVPRRGKTRGLVSGRRRGRSSAGRWSTRRARRA